MTRAEAAKELQSYADHSWGGLNEAFEVAISALKYGGPQYVLLSTPPEDAQTVDTGVPYTNADHIRSMTDEELAELLARETFRIAKPCFDAFGYGLEEQVIYARRLDWLKQPFSGGE